MYLKEFNFLIKVNKVLIENYNLSLSEATKFSDAIITALKKFNLEIPEDIPQIKEIDKGESDKTLTVILKDRDKKQQVKIGKLLRQIYPKLIDAKVEKIGNEIKKQLTGEKEEIKSKYEFILNNNISEEYFKCETEYNLSSCMTKPWRIEQGLLKIYDLLGGKDIKILLMKNKETNNFVGRALVWYNTNINKPYIDRFYTEYDMGEQYKEYMELYNIMAVWAEKNGYAYKGPGREDMKVNNSDEQILYYQIPKDVWEQLDWMPYMDTFAYGTKDGLLSNNEKLLNKEFIFQKPNGILIKKSDENFIRWNEGTWKGGTWPNGIWVDGMWENGVWKNGQWMGGEWENGVWEKGYWKEGTWYNGVWKGGRWVDGEWWDGKFLGGIWEKGIWNSGTFNGGKWVSGGWIDGNWIEGEIYSKRFRAFVKSKVNPKKFKEIEKTCKKVEELQQKVA